MLMGGSFSDAIKVAGSMGQGQTTTQEYTPSAEEQELATFAKRILAGTEDVWTRIFAQYGKTYVPPKLVLFTGSVQSGCGGATSSSGPFYCSADQSVYLDLSFFMNMKKQIGADGDFAYAYVIAHEVGHHVQNQLGILGQAHQQMSRMSEKESNKVSVRLELQADYFAGVWAHHDNKLFGSLESGDIDEGLAVAAKIGDDYLQKQAYGYTVPESFNHGTSQQRSRWLKKGIQTGDINQGDTFSVRYEAL
jgi:predicted metalloprotease